MSPDVTRAVRHRHRPRTAGAMVALVGAATLGCGGDRTNGVRSVGRAGADSVWHTSSPQPATAALPTPTLGFTSAHGAAAAGPVAAAHMAPPPPAPFTRALGAEETAAVTQIPVGPGHDLVVGDCLVCHASTMIAQQDTDTGGWNKTVTQMVA